MDPPNKSKSLKIDSTKPKRRRLRVGDPDFVPPDGGWGWLIVFACGFSNLSLFPMFQQFGLVFRQKFENLDITTTQTTTVINMNSACNSCVGLLNGPIYRKFTYRKVAIFGSLLVTSSLFISTMCESFWTHLVFYSICYGSGIGLTQGANALALNTFFKKKRRIATGLSWTTTALGPIVWPYIITALLELYEMEGTLLIFASFALHAFMCSLLLQPVEWHTKFKDVPVAEEAKPFLDKDAESGLVGGKLKKSTKSRSLLSSQYIYNEDDPHATGYEIVDPGHPMMVRSNDGWYSRNRSLSSSRMSLASNKTNRGTSKHPSGQASKYPSGQSSVTMSKRPSYSNLQESRSKRNSSVNLAQDNKERKRDKRSSQSKKTIIREEEENHENPTTLQVPGEYHEKDVLKTAARMLEEYKQERKEIEEDNKEEEHKKLTFFHKLCIFFDFDLFKDPVYVNLMLGITIANFVEINFSIITPMVLTEFNFGKYEIATFMSLLGTTDILVRFFVPFVAEKIGWENRTFFLIGVLSMAFGRVILVHTQSYIPGLVVAMIIGAGKGLRTIFMALVIPSHVPLERLPAASGLQLAVSGLFFLILGPVIGWIRDLVGDYVITLHLLNILTYVTAIAWTIESKLIKKKSEIMKTKEDNNVTG